MHRRIFTKKLTLSALSASLMSFDMLKNVTIAIPEKQFKMCLKPGAVGIKVSQQELLSLAHQYGFEAIEPFHQTLTEMDDNARKAFLAEMETKNIVWGVGGLPIEFRASEAQFTEDLKKLPQFAEAMQAVGVKGMGTWIMPTNKYLTYLENFELHTKRLKKVARILENYDLKLGLEYVGPKTLMARDKYAFIRSMKACKELINHIDERNVGLILDSFHWFCAGESVADILALKKEEIITCDLNDARKGFTADEQIDGKRELPAATGVIDIKGFLEALVQIGYDGPIRAEPFNAVLNEMDNATAAKTTYDAMRKAFNMIG